MNNTVAVLLGLLILNGLVVDFVLLQQKASFAVLKDTQASSAVIDSKIVQALELLTNRVMSSTAKTPN